MKTIRILIPALLLQTALTATSTEQRKPAFSTSVGTQTISAAYKFTDDTHLVETAKEILRMGGDTLKFTVSTYYDEAYYLERDDKTYKTALDLISKHPSYVEVLDMPFRNMMFWLYPMSETWTAFDTGRIPEAEAKASYKEIYDVTAYLLKKYSGSGKSFYIGNWEGDWHLTGNYDYDNDASEAAVKGAIEWFKLREKAVSDARRDTPHNDVEVYFYVELNHVAKAITEDRPAIVNKVLPHIRTDYVSWSSYDTTQRAAELGGETGRKMVFDALDYIERNLPPSDIPGKRVMIGEYGFKQEWVKDPEIQEKYTAELIKWGLEWGCPFILYWELYCNEINEDNGKHRGFWLIDDKGTKLPVYYLHYNFLKKANAFVEDYQKQHGELPPQEQFNKQALQWIKLRDDVKPAPPAHGPNP